MLIRMDLVLSKARDGGYGIAAPNVFDGETVRACFDAALDLRAPMIIDASQRVDSEYIADVTRFYSERHPQVPVSLNLDHGRSFDVLVNAIRAGFTSVMIDRSDAPFDDNAKETKEIVKIAHAAGVSVEAEIGYVGQGSDYELERESALTNVQDAVRFINETGADCLAVAIGTAHGKYVGEPRLDFERLKALRHALSVPLVIHGGSSTGDANLARAVELGVTKINLATDLMCAGAQAIAEYFGQSHEPRLPDVVNAGVRGYRAELVRYMNLFGQGSRW